jgi:tetratricopeptide (TPR) repeat protein
MENFWDELLEKFNNNELDVEKYFNDYQTFFRMLSKRDLMDELDPRVGGSYSENWQNEYLIWLYENHKEKFYKWVQEFLQDIVIENGQAYLEIQDRSELARLFCKNGRGDVSRESIESILSGDSDWEPYWDTTEDVYKDVIEELTPENDKTLGDYIVTNLKDIKIPTETEELELIANEQGHPEYAIINHENVIRIIDDEETMNGLLNNQLQDLKSELYSIHSGAYNNAYEEEIWTEIWSELGTYFEGQGQFITKKHPYKKNTEIQYFKVPLVNFDSDIIDYLHNNKNYGNSGTLEYHGSYLSIMAEDRDCLSIRVPDGPDFRTVDKNINLYFKDYI